VSTIYCRPRRPRLWRLWGVTFAALDPVHAPKEPVVGEITATIAPRRRRHRVEGTFVSKLPAPAGGIASDSDR